MKSGKNRVRLTARNVRVHLAGQAVEPGDFIRGDQNGVIVVPAARIDEVVVLCQSIEAMEADVLSDVMAGIPLREARQRRGYNQFALGGSVSRTTSS
jgi:regulator of RNase E activity RraA